MKVFFDMEFTGLHQNTTPISIGCIDEKNRSFYAEFTDYDKQQVEDSPWLKDNIISNLYMGSEFGSYHYDQTPFGSDWAGGAEFVEVKGDKKYIAENLKDFLSFHDHVEMWSDCLAYDWMLFCQLWGHAFNIPENVYYVPFDICTVFEVKGVDPDVNREEFAEMKRGRKKHNAHWDARVIKACYQKLVSMKNL